MQNTKYLYFYININIYKLMKEQVQQTQNNNKRNNVKSKKNNLNQEAPQVQIPKYVPPAKSSLCRFFLRGICPYPSVSCYFAHGVQQLKFKPFDQSKQQGMKEVYYDYRFPHPFNQLNSTVAEQKKNYINLYQFQLEIKKQLGLSKIDMHQESCNQVKTQTEFERQTKIQQANQQIEQKQLSVSFKQSFNKIKHQYDHNLKNQAIKQNTSIYNPHSNYTLQQINKNRQLKIQIRKQFHQNQFKLFLEMLERQYSNKNFANNQPYRFYYQILQLEYYRVGFNKLMTRIKISFLFDFLQLKYNGGYFKLVTIMPPIRNKPTIFYLKLASYDLIYNHYHKLYSEIQSQYKNQGKNLRQEDVRLHMIKSQREWWHIPPIIQLTRIKHCTFKQFLINYIVKNANDQNEKKLDWVTDESIQIAEIHKIIQKQIQKKEYCIVASDILSKSPKFNRVLVQKCVSMQRKQCINNEQKELERLIFFKCPNIKTQIITRQSYIKPQSKYQHQFNLAYDILIENCIQFEMNKLRSPNIKKISTQQIIFEQKQKVDVSAPDQLEDYKIIEISTAYQLLSYTTILLNKSTILGVDLEGDLNNQNGSLSLIQINNYSQKIIYLIDFLTISQKDSVQNFEKCKDFLSQIFYDSSKVIIIHDSRNDAQCLLRLLKKYTIQPLQNQKLTSKLLNIFDTAASQQVIRQLQNYDEYIPNTPGLNEVLAKYKQLKNPHKKKFHDIWAQEKQDPSRQRPLNQEFKQYCVMDVLGLPKVYMAMIQKVNPYFLTLVSNLHVQWIEKNTYANCYKLKQNKFNNSRNIINTQK